MSDEEHATQPDAPGLRGILTLGLLSVPAATAVQRRDLQRSIASHDAPVFLTMSGLLLVGYSSIAFLVDPSGGLIAHAADLPVGLLMIAVGLVLRRTGTPAGLASWLVASMSLLVVFALLLEVWRAPAALATAYVLLVICAFGPPTLAWPPFLTVAPVMILAVGVVTHTWTPTEWLDWMAAAFAAALIGATTLAVRIRSVNALADVNAEVERLAVTDPLTNLLNRHGLSVQLPPILANARRYRQPMFVAFIDIDGLKQANDRHGHDFGDAVIFCVATAVKSTVREGDLVARWGGDELIVVGAGAAPDRIALGDRLAEHIARSGIDLERWPGRVSLGFAEADPGSIDIEQLIADADADMYRRRRDR